MDSSERVRASFQRILDCSKQIIGSNDDLRLDGADANEDRNNRYHVDNDSAATHASPSKRTDERHARREVSVAARNNSHNPAWARQGQISCRLERKASRPPQEGMRRKAQFTCVVRLSELEMWERPRQWRVYPAIRYGVGFDARYIWR